MVGISEGNPSRPRDMIGISEDKQSRPHDMVGISEDNPALPRDMLGVSEDNPVRSPDAFGISEENTVDNNAFFLGHSSSTVSSMWPNRTGVSRDLSNVSGDGHLYDSTLSPSPSWAFFFLYESARRYVLGETGRYYVGIESERLYFPDASMQR